jgi:hypothetical protein
MTSPSTIHTYLVKKSVREKKLTTKRKFISPGRKFSGILNYRFIACICSASAFNTPPHHFFSFLIGHDFMYLAYEPRVEPERPPHLFMGFSSSNCIPDVPFEKKLNSCASPDCNNLSVLANIISLNCVDSRRSVCKYDYVNPSENLRDPTIHRQLIGSFGPFAFQASDKCYPVHLR